MATTASQGGSGVKAMARSTLKKLPRADRELLRRIAFGGASDADRRRYLTLDSTEQGQRDMRAICMRMGRSWQRQMNETILAVMQRRTLSETS